MNYQLFIPPETISQKDPKSWSLREAELYFNWLVSSVESRLNMLGAYLGVEIKKDENGLATAAEKAASSLMNTPFSDSGNLTNAGFALSADLGILIAECLLTSFPGKLRWEILRQKKVDLSYNRPVIQGFSSGLYLDPIHISINQARRVIAKTHGFETYLETYRYWCSRAV